MLQSSNTEKEKVLVHCLECAHGVFMQWFDNPVVAYCRETEERQVAMSPRLCPNYRRSLAAEPEIHHFDCYAEGQLESVINPNS
jgi:hypothetical protein